MKAVGALGTVAMALALAAPASAATITVDSSAADGCNGSPATCKTITQAAAQAASNDTILIRTGFYAESPSFSDSGLTVSGTLQGPVIVAGKITFTSATSTTDKLQRVLVTSTTANTPAVQVDSPGVGTLTLDVESSILSGNGTGAGIAGSGGLTTSVQVNGRHVTIADGGSAPPTSLSTGGLGTAAAGFTDSIVLGTPSGNPPSFTNTDRTSDPAALFVAPSQENFFLRVGSPAIDQGAVQSESETTEDVEGQTRAGTWDRGADEFVNHAPTAPGLGVSSTTARTGQTVAYGAFSVPDPDADRGDAVTTYRFDFGDGQTQDSGGPGVTHTYAAPGQYPATVRLIDRLGAVSPPSNTQTVTVSSAGGLGGGGGDTGANDKTSPSLSITSPRPGQRLKRGKRAPVLRGRMSDDTGISSVEIALRRFEKTRCRWYYPTRRSFVLGSCSKPRFFRAVVNDFTWKYTFARKVVPGTGRYELRARATDVRGNRTTVFSSAARTLVGFRIVR